MTHRDHLSVPPGRRKAAGDAGPSSRLFDALRRHAEVTGTAAFQGFRAQDWRTASRTPRDAPASPRRTLLTESLGKPSLWVIISAPWYNLPFLLMISTPFGGQWPQVRTAAAILSRTWSGVTGTLPTCSHLAAAAKEPGIEGMTSLPGATMASVALASRASPSPALERHHRPPAQAVLDLRYAGPGALEPAGPAGGIVVPGDGRSDPSANFPGPVGANRPGFRGIFTIPVEIMAAEARGPRTVLEKPENGRRKKRKR